MIYSLKTILPGVTPTVRKKPWLHSAPTTYSERSSSRPILVTGAHRSGTTWASSMLNLAPGTLMTEEPMNVRPHRYAFDSLSTDYFTYAEELEPDQAIAAFERILNRDTGKVFSRRSPQRYLKFTRRGRYIIKDPIACLSSDWLARNFDLDVLVLIRHPGAFAASLKRMNWNPKLSCYFKQPRLTAEYLRDLEAEYGGRSLSFIEAAAVAWRIMYRVLAAFAARHPEWIVVRHEDLASNPIREFNDIYNRMSLEWTDEVYNGIDQHCSPGNRAEAQRGSVHTLKRDSRSIINSWKTKLDDNEKQTLRDLSGPEWTYWYGAESWK